MSDASYVLTLEARASLQSAFDQAEVDGKWYLVYDAIINAISYVDANELEPPLAPVPVRRPQPGVDANVLAWVLGARDVNAGVGGASDFIRKYSEEQYRIRFGTAAPDTQDISNRVCKSVAIRLLSAPNTVPNLHEVGEKDANEAIKGYFSEQPGGWSGNLLFMFLGDTSFYRDNILNSSLGTYDFAAMIKSAVAAVGPADDLSELFGNVFKSLKMSFGAVLDNGQGTIGNLSNLAVVLTETSAFLNAQYGAGLTDIGKSHYILGLSGTQAEKLESTSDDDYINAGAGNDTILAAGGLDLIDGGAGLDVVDYGEMDTRIAISTENLSGGGARLLVTKGSQGSSQGADILVDVERLVLGSRDDTVAFGDGFSMNGGTLDVDAAGGRDTLSFATRTDAMTLTLSVGNSNSGLGVQLSNSSTMGLGRLDGFEIFRLGKGDDTAVFDETGSAGRRISLSIDGGDGSDVLSGGTGNDTLIGGAGRDTLFGGDGDDVLDGGATIDTSGALLSTPVWDLASDVLSGGDGLDTYYVQRVYKYLVPGYSRPQSPVGYNSDYLNAGEFFKPTAPPWTSRALGMLDHIVDSDGRGRIFVDGTKLATATFTRLQNNTYDFVADTGDRSGDGKMRFLYAKIMGESVAVFNAVGDFLVFVDGETSPALPAAMAVGANTSNGASTTSAGTAGSPQISSSFLGMRFVDVMNRVSADGASGAAVGTDADDAIFGSTGAETLIAGDGNDVVHGDGGNDNIFGGAGYDDLAGDAGDDSIWGGDGDDQLSGGVGDDALDGGAGSDTYRWQSGDGSDTISDWWNADEADELDMSGVDLQKLDFVRGGANNADLSVTDTATGETITIQGQFYTGSGTGVESVVVGSTRLDANTLASMAWYRGGSGNDGFWGGDLGERFDGRAGDDTLFGAGGSDTFLYRAGDGNDLIGDYGAASDVDRLVLTDLNRSAVTVSRATDDIWSAEIHVGSTGETIRLDHQFVGAEYGIEAIDFADGTSMTAADLALAAPFEGTSGTDYLYGTAASETFDGRLGNDVLVGGAGDDVYRYASGDGNDIIDDTDGTADRLVFSDLTASDVRLLIVGDDLHLDVLGTGETITDTGHFTSATRGLDQIAFSGGTTWSRTDIASHAVAA